MHFVRLLNEWNSSCLLRLKACYYRCLSVILALVECSSVVLMTAVTRVGRVIVCKEDFVLEWKIGILMSGEIKDTIRCNNKIKNYCKT